jgi:hypothetical protein
MQIFDGRQITAARALADITTVALARKAGVSSRAIHRLEVAGEFQVSERRSRGDVGPEVWSKIVAALQDEGVELLPQGTSHGSGVRWSRPRSLRNAAES